MIFYKLLFIVFLVLKLTGQINWSWWWVTAPLWGGFIATIVFQIGYVIYLEAYGTQQERLALRMKGYIKW